MFSSSCSFRFLGLRRASRRASGALALGRSLFISLGTDNTSRDVLSCNSLCLVFVLLSLAREGELLLLSILGKLSTSVLLSLAREEDLSVRGLFSTMSDFLSRAREMSSPLLNTVSNFLSRAREMSSPSCFYNTEIIISKLLSVFRSASTIRTASSFFSLLTSLRSNRCDYVPKTNCWEECTA